MREDPRHILDDIEALTARDPSDMLGLVEQAGDQWRTAVAVADSFTPPDSWWW